MVCVGRKAFTKNLNLENASLKTNNLGQLEVNKYLQTSVKNIFAIGDLIPGPMLAHKAEEEGVAVAEYIATGWCHVNYNTIPSVMYTWPEAASVGKTEQELKRSKHSLCCGFLSFFSQWTSKNFGITQKALLRC